MEIDVQSGVISENEEFTTPHETDEFDFEEQNAQLEERLKNLKETMSALKDQLIEEKEAWKKEIEDAYSVAKSVGITSSCDHECCNSETLYKTEIDVDSTYCGPTLSEMTILDYEHKLASYQEALTKAHAERRNILKRQLAANAYKKRLLEVENLCNMELQKVKQNFQYLQPLQALAQEWDSNIPENVTKFDEELTGKFAKTSLETNSHKSGEAKGDFITVETLENKIYNDFKEIASQISPLSSHATCSSLCMNEDEDLMAKRLQSMSWYNNEIGHSAFNPLM